MAYDKGVVTVAKLRPPVGFFFVIRVLPSFAFLGSCEV